MELGNNAENRKLTLLQNEENCFAHIGKNAKKLCLQQREVSFWQ